MKAGNILKKAIVCETAFQIIVALYIRYQFKKQSDEFDIIITDTFNEYESIANRIKDIGVFDNVIIVKAKQIISPFGIKNKVCNAIKIFSIEKLINKLFINGISHYKTLYYWNYDVFTVLLRSYFELKNIHPKIYVFEEGYITYMPIEKVVPKHTLLKISEFRNYIYGLKNVSRENISGLLVFEPDLLLFKTKYPIIKIDRSIIEKTNLKEDVNYIFNASVAIGNYDRRYIIFEEGFAAMHPEIDDYNLYKKIIDKVGTDNVIIKLHPRTKVNRFEKLGVKVLGSDGIPWEAIVLAGKFSDKVLIAIGSGSLTNCRLLFGTSIESYLLFRLYKTGLPQFNEEFDPLWEHFKISTDQYGLHIPGSEQELFNMLNRNI